MTWKIRAEAVLSFPGANGFRGDVKQKREDGTNGKNGTNRKRPETV
jgi:hypothetical protein